MIKPLYVVKTHQSTDQYSIYRMLENWPFAFYWGVQRTLAMIQPFEDRCGRQLTHTQWHVKSLRCGLKRKIMLEVWFEGDDADGS